VLVGVVSDSPDIAPVAGVEQDVNDVGCAAEVVFHGFWTILHIEIDVHAVVEREFGVGLVDGHVASSVVISKVVGSIKKQLQSARRQNRRFWAC
jgi:hypothetical protein